MGMGEAGLNKVEPPSQARRTIPVTGALNENLVFITRYARARPTSARKSGVLLWGGLLLAAMLSAGAFIALQPPSSLIDRLTGSQSSSSATDSEAAIRDGTAISVQHERAIETKLEDPLTKSAQTPATSPADLPKRRSAASKASPAPVAPFVGYASPAKTSTRMAAGQRSKPPTRSKEDTADAQTPRPEQPESDEQRKARLEAIDAVRTLRLQ